MNKVENIGAYKNRRLRRIEKSVIRKQEEKTRKAVKPNTGYKGQDYAMYCDYNGNMNFCVGWTNDPTGGKILDMINLHPGMSNGRIHKLTDDEKALLKKQFNLS